MKRLTKRWELAACAGMMALAGNAVGQDAVESLDSLETLTVIGSTEDVFRLPGSGYYMDSEELRIQNYTNVNRILARVPGVYVREEDGYGNFSNISIRGADGTRSEKVTIMEDGILSAPAPYSAPSAYYSPKAARMSGIEILKGSSQVRYGPQTSGGVINYLSTEVPVDHNFYTRNTFGSDNEILSHTYYGDIIETDAGRFGYLLELFHNEADGFRTIDPATGYGGSDDTGFQMTEPMLKVFWEPNTPVRQRLEFKYGYTDFEADETYTGLSEIDVRATPDRRYAATRFDNMDTRQQRTYLKYLIEPTDNLRFETALYYNSFERNWHKLDDVEFASAVPQNVRNALMDPVGLALLQGTGAGSLIVRNNAREYEAYGIQFSGEWDFQTGTVLHGLNFGARLHHDYVERDQFDEVYNQDGTGEIVTTQYQLNNVRRQESDALALWIEDEIRIGNLTLTPGLRWEYVDFEQRDGSEDKSRVDTFAEMLANRAGVTYADSSDDISELIPGMSFTYECLESTTFFGGVYKGISIPGPRSSIGGTDVEESIGYELGTRYRNECVNAELVGFFTDYDNILNTNAGTGIGTAATNGGEAEVWGFEGLVTYDPFIHSEVSTPMYVSATWTSAEFKNAITAGGSDNIYAGAVDGSEIPYIPEWKLAAGIGYKQGRWGANLDATYESSTFATGRNLDDPVGAADGFGAREGKTDSLLIFDLSTHFEVTENVTLLAGIGNLFDERGVVSRIPRGPRANRGRSFYGGFEATF